MKILVVTNGYPPHGRFGTEFYSRELVLGLRARGHEPFVLYPVRDGSQARYSLERVRVDDVPVFLVHNPGDPGKAFEASYADARVEELFRVLVRELEPDVVHFTYLLWGLSVRLPVHAKALGVPSIATATDYGLLCHRGQMFDADGRLCGGPHPPSVCAACIRRPGRWDHSGPERLARSVAARLLALVGGAGRVVVSKDLERREAAVAEALAALSALVVPTKHLGEVFVRAGFDRKRLVPLVYSFDETPYADVSHVPSPDEVRFGFLGQFAPHKGFDVLMAAVAELERLHPSDGWRVELYGAPSEGRHRRFAAPYLDQLDARRVRRGIPFEPEDAPAVLAALSALILPSRWDENAPLSVLQARAAGVPVLASDVPGIREIVAEGVHGRLVPPDDPVALARAMAAVIDGRVGKNVTAGLPLDLNTHLARLEELYERARAGRVKGAPA